MTFRFRREENPSHLRQTNTSDRIGGTLFNQDRLNDLLWQRFRAGPGAYHAALGDVNRDGKADVAVSSFEGKGLTVLLAR